MGKQLSRNNLTLVYSGFGGLGVACCLKVPKFAGWNPAEAVTIFQGKKILSTPSFGGEVKPSVPCCRFAACKRSLNVTWKSKFRQNYRSSVSPTIPPFAARISHVVWTWRHLAVEVGTSKPRGGGSGSHSKPYRLRCIWSVCSGPWWRRRTLVYAGNSVSSSGVNPPKIGPIGCPKMPVRNYHYSLHYNSEECSSPLHHGWSLKPRISVCCCWVFYSYTVLSAVVKHMQCYQN